MYVAKTVELKTWLAGMVTRSRSKIIKSANLPLSKLPFSPSSKLLLAAQIVMPRSASCGDNAFSI